MNNDNLREFAVIIMTLSECFVGKDKPSKQLIEIYFRALEEYDIKDVQHACNMLVKTWGFHFMPKPADFIKHIVGDENTNALKARQGVLSRIEKVGVQNAKFDEATTRAIDACGGSIAIGHAPKDKLTFMCKDFVNNFKVTIKRVEHGAIDNQKLNELTSGIGEIK